MIVLVVKFVICNIKSQVSRSMHLICIHMGTALKYLHFYLFSSSNVNFCYLSKYGEPLKERKEVAKLII